MVYIIHIIFLSNRVNIVIFHWIELGTSPYLHRHAYSRRAPVTRSRSCGALHRIRPNNLRQSASRLQMQDIAHPEHKFTARGRIRSNFSRVRHCGVNFILILRHGGGFPPSWWIIYLSAVGWPSA